MRLISPLLLALLFFACTTESSPVEQPVTESLSTPAPPYADRMEKATARLSTNAPAQKVLQAIEAHGGLESWYTQSPLSYHFNYQPLDGGTPRNTIITNDYVKARAVHRLATDTSQVFGFDGERAWSVTGEKIAGMSPRFWSLTPYYFVGLPFVLADEGINFAALPAAELDGTTYDLVKVTFTEGTGDADDDYYVLYLHPETHQLDALRYIVSYPGFFPDGGALPEKLMKITGKTTVEGITLPAGYVTRWWNEGEPGEPITEIEVSDYEFLDGEVNMEMPATAKVFNDLPSSGRDRG